MKYNFKGFYHIAPVKQSAIGDGSFVYTVIFFVLNTEDNSVSSNTAEISVPGSTTNADTNPFILNSLMQRVNVMNGMMPMPNPMQ
jgi:hypothetical protein